MAKNLKVGDLVKVKHNCEKISCSNEWFAPDMALYEGKEFVVNCVNSAYGDNLYELRDVSKDAQYQDVEDWSFSGKWLTKVKNTAKKGLHPDFIGGFDVNWVVKPTDELKTAEGITYTKRGDVPVKNLSVQHKGESTIFSTSGMYVGEVAEFITELAKPVVERQVAMIKSSTGLTLILDGTTYNLQNDHVNYDKIVKRLANKEYLGLEDLINVSKSVEAFGEGKLSVKGGVVSYDNKQLHGCITDSILGLIKDGFSVEPIVNFLDNLSKNPSFRAQNELYGFLEYGKLPITEDGCFLTYKKIRKDWKDIHSGTFDNSIGTVCEMPRHKVDDNSSNTCSSGLHVCSYEYTKSFGGHDSRLVLCKVNPADVVSIPVDYNNTKMRCCKYVVVAEVNDKSDVLKGKSLYKESKC